MPVIHDKLKTTESTETHQIRFTAYGTQEAHSKLFAVAESYSIWAKAGGFIDIPKSEWMPIPLKPGAKPTGGKVYQLGPEDRKLIDDTFDLLHQQGKME